MVWEGGAAEEVWGARVYFLVEIRLAFDASADYEAELYGVGDECGEAEVGLLECNYMCAGSGTVLVTIAVLALHLHGLRASE